MRKILIFLIFAFFSLKLSAQTKIEEVKLSSGIAIEIFNDGTWKEKDKSIVNGSITDARDSKNYKIVKIGTQTWMAENLSYKASSGCWAYDNNATNVAKYGYLYDWETAKKACPSGWHLPSDTEWTTLSNYLGGDDVAGDKMKSSSGWNDFNEKSGNGTNTSNFTAHPGGCLSADATFKYIGEVCLWWSSTENNAGNAYQHNLSSYGSGIGRGSGDVTYGFSVRCIMNL